MKKLLPVFAFAMMLTAGPIVSAEETVPEKIEAGTQKGINSVKKTWRNAKNEVCETMNGKVHCMAENAKGKLKGAGESIEAKAKETKNKVD